MTSQEDAAQRATSEIQRQFPSLEIHSFAFAGEGLNSTAFRINGEVIFRFPKIQEAADELQAEIALLPKLRPAVRLAIPDFQYVATQDNGYPFVGYQAIPGVALEQDVLRGLPADVQERLIKDIAGFLTDVHAFPVDEAKACRVKSSDFKNNYTDNLEHMRKDVYERLDGTTRDYVEALHQGYLTDPANFDYTPALLHADLSPDHILYDNVQQKITGVIDFGDIDIGDPDYDLIYLYEDYWGEGFIRELLKYYPHPDPERLMRKLEFFSRADTVDTVLMGIERKDEALMQKGLIQLKKDAMNTHQ